MYWSRENGDRGRTKTYDESGIRTHAREDQMTGEYLSLAP